MANPTPVPTPTYTPSYASSIPRGDVLGAQQVADWNTQWNQIWNQAWNAGYNRSSMPSVDPSFQSAVNQGYSAGLSAAPAIKDTGGAKQTTSYNLSSQPSQSYNPSNQPSGPSAEDLARQQAEAALNQGYNDYFAQLDKLLNEGLPGQKSAQEQIAQEQYQQGLNTLGLQQTQGLQTLGTQRTEAQQNQQKTLKDLGANLRNAFMAGNIFLGARGAGDSSAANQYAYALTKLANQQRGDIMTKTQNIMRDIQNKEDNLKNIYDTEVRNLESQKNAKMAEIAKWFYDAQNTISLQKGAAQKERSQQLLNIAVSNLQMIQQEAANQRSLLEQWVANKATDLQGLLRNMAAVTSGTYNYPTTNPLTGPMTVNPEGGVNIPKYVPSTSTEEKKSIFNQPYSYISGAANPTNYWTTLLGR